MVIVGILAAGLLFVQPLEPEIRRIIHRKLNRKAPVLKLRRRASA